MKIFETLKQKKWLAALLAAELVFLLAHFALAMKTQPAVTLTGADLIPQISAAQADDSNALTVQDSEEYGPFALSPEISLKKGSYLLSVHYSSNLEGGKVRQKNAYITMNELVLPASVNVAECSLRANGDTTCLLDFTYNGGTRTIYSITITPTHGWARTSTLGWLLFFVLADLLVLGIKGLLPCCHWDYRTRLVWLGLGCIFAFSCLPLFCDYLFSGHDLSFHLNRIQGIADGLTSGQFPVRIYPTHLQGQGYASGIFYGDLFLYLPALLRIIGYSLQDCYKIYLAAVNLITVLVSYWCFRRIFSSRFTALAGTALYSLSLYRLINLYVRAAVGEYTATLFLPLVFYLLWAVFTQPTDSPEYKQLWIPGVLGYAGLIFSHILTCGMVAIFTILACLVYLRRVLRKPTFIVLTKVVLYTTLVSLWFLLPFLDYMRLGELLVNTNVHSIWSTLDYCLFPNQMLDIFPHATGLIAAVSLTMIGEMSFSVGAPLWLGAVLLLGLSLDPEAPRSGARRLGWVSLLFGALSFWMTTTLFPWYELSTLLSPINAFVSAMQFPSRFLVIVCLLLTVSAAAAFHLFCQRFPKLIPTLCGVLFALLFLTAGYFYADLYRNVGGSFVYDMKDCLDHYGSDAYGHLCSQLGGAEYLPSEADLDTLWDATAPQYDSEAVTLTEYRKNSLTVTTQVQNSSSESQSITLPVIYYRDYQAITDSGEQLPTANAGNAQLCVTVPAGFNGSVTVRFAEPWYWRAAELVSLLSAAGLLGLSFLRRQKNRSTAI